MKKIFIKLTSLNGNPIFINTMMITSIEEIKNGNSNIFTMSDSIFTVSESPSEILKLIDKSDTFTLKNYSE